MITSEKHGQHEHHVIHLYLLTSKRQDRAGGLTRTITAAATPVLLKSRIHKCACTYRYCLIQPDCYRVPSLLSINYPVNRDYHGELPCVQ